MVRFHNYSHLQNNQNVQVSTEVEVFLRKNVLQRLHHQQLT